MGKYIVKTMVTFYGVVEAESEQDAEQMGWDWEEEYMTYDGVYSIDVEETEDDDEEGEDDD
jgi:hypothetical protein